MAKRIFSLIISFVLLISCVGLVSADAEEKSIVRFGVFSDTHNNADGISNVFNNIYALSDNGETLDGVVMNGDITYMQAGVTPAKSHYATLLANEKYQELKEAGKLVYEMGNHEFPLNSQEDAALTQQSFDMFKEQTGFDPQMHTVMSGYHFINAAPGNYAGGMQAAESFMRAELDKALADGEDKPVFLVVHHPVPSSVIGSPGATSTRFSLGFREYLNSQPRIIVFSGHTHDPESDPRSIRQYVGGCTYVATGHVAGGNNVSDSYATIAHSKKSSQAMMVEIEPDTNVVTFKRFYVDKTAPQYLEEEDWIIDIPKMIAAKETESESDDLAAYKYTFEDRSAKAVSPTFEQGSQITASNVAAESVTLSFPKAIEGKNGDDNLVKYYEMKVYDLESAQVVKTEVIFSDYFLKESERRQTFSHTVTGLSQDSSYKIEVCAMTSWNKKSKPISVEFQTLEKEEFENVTFDADNTYTVLSDDMVAVPKTYQRNGYIQVPNTAYTHKYTATFSFDTSGMYRFMATQIGADGAPTKLEIKRVEENGTETVIKTGESYISTGGPSKYTSNVPYADVAITPGTYKATWTRGQSGETATLLGIKAARFAPLPVEYLDEYVIEKTASEYFETSETVEDGVIPESFTLMGNGYVSWNITPDYPGIYKLSYDFSGEAKTTVISPDYKISGDTITTLPVDSTITADGELELNLFEGVSYNFILKAASDNTIVNGMKLAWVEDFTDLENESYKFTYDADTDLAYGNYNLTTANVEPAYFEKEITVPLDANYTFSINAGSAGNRSLRAYIERVKGGNVTFTSTGATDTIENRVLFTDVPLIAGESYKVSIINGTSNSTIRISDLIFETSGEYLPDADDLTILASDFNSWPTGKLAVTMSNKHRMALTDNYNMTFKLKPGAGNYKVYAWCRTYTGTPSVNMYVDGSQVSTSSYSWTGTPTEYELGTICVTDDEFTLKIALPNTTDITRLWFYRFRLVKIDEPEVVVYSGNTTELANVTNVLTEGSMTAKAYLPKALSGKKVTMFMAIYEDNSLYKVGTYSITAKKNSIEVVTLDDIAFEEGKTYKSKVFFWENSEDLVPLYGVLKDGCLTNQ